MTAQDVPEPLRHYLRTFFHLEGGAGPEWGAQLRNSFSLNPAAAESFRQQLAALIVQESLDTEAFRTLTHHQFDSERRLYRFLRERWDDIYGEDTPIPGDE